MRLTDALTKLKSMDIPVVKTNDAAGCLRVSPAIASKILSRLAIDGHVQPLVRGTWLIDRSVHPWTIHPYLSDPAPSYISLQTALFHHGMIDQIPSLVHVMSLGKTRTFKTPSGTFAFHQVTPEFFCGFESLMKEGGPAQIATPEKAIIDFLYLRMARSRSFRSLPEMTIPKSFKKEKMRAFARLIHSVPRRLMVERMIEEITKKLTLGGKI